MNVHLPDNPTRSALFADLYQFTMSQAYAAEAMRERAAFELFFRELPEQRNYVVAAGLDDVLGFLESFQFARSELEYLRSEQRFSEPFLEELGRLRFTGDVDAVPEGTVVFPHEPLLRVTAPIAQAQLVETFILNQVHFQSVIASKAARVVDAARGRSVVDFGSRRAHGTDAALHVARASYLVGASGTSNMLAGKRFGIPTFGTMAHSYIQAHDDEADALAAFARTFPGTTLLVDTYDTLEGVRRVIDLSRQAGEGLDIQGVRLDSGDLAALAHRTRRLLDEADLQHVKIFASSSLDEYVVADLLEAGTPIDGFGVGTKMSVSEDAPSLDMAYKLIEYAGRPRMKLSSGKALRPGRKQVFRTMHDGRMIGDEIAEAEEDLPGEPLLQPVMRGGERLPASHVTIDQSRDHAARQRQFLPELARSNERMETPYVVRFSARLQQRRRQVQQRWSTQTR